MRTQKMNQPALISIVLIAACLTTGTYAGDDSSPGIPDQENFRIFLLAGQSNMAGRGDLAEADLEVNPQILMLTRDGNWQAAMDPVHYDKKIAGVGLARYFAAELVKRNPAITIGLVPTAIGGSPIAMWKPGAYHEKTSTHPYDDAIARAKRAMQDGTLHGILWHQGEGDSGDEKSLVHKDNLIDLIKRFRKDLGMPELPFIIGQLGQFEGKPWSPGRQRVNQAHIDVAEEIPNAGFVSSDGLTDKGDLTHFNAGSLKEFGRRYAEVYLQLVGD